MARRQYKVPFAATGDVVSIPEVPQPDGSVSLQQGYGFDYQRDPSTDPLAKVFPRDVHNGILNEITASIGEIQQYGYPIWTLEGAPYPINTVVRHDDENWRSTIANNNNSPSALNGWEVAGSVPNATEAVAGKAKIATTAITQAGGNDTDFITPKKLKDTVLSIGSTRKTITLVSGTTYTNATNKPKLIGFTLKSNQNINTQLSITVLVGSLTYKVAVLSGSLDYRSEHHIWVLPSESFTITIANSTTFFDVAWEIS